MEFLREEYNRSLNVSTYRFFSSHWSRDLDPQTTAENCGFPREGWVLGVLLLLNVTRSPCAERRRLKTIRQAIS